MLFKLLIYIRIICKPKSCSARDIIVRIPIVVCVHVCCCFVDDSKRRIFVNINDINSWFGNALARIWNEFSVDFGNDKHKLASHNVWIID